MGAATYGVAAALAAALAALGGCDVDRPTFQCGAWTDCGPGGVCEPGTSACSLPDDSCPTGRRFSELSVKPLASTCVAIEPGAGRAGLCATSADCGQLRECLGNRCVSIDELSSSLSLTCASCAIQPAGGRPIFCWGQTSLLSPFKPMELFLNHYFCPEPATCPLECRDCTTSPCPPHCNGTRATLTFAVGDNHLCIGNGEGFCFGDNAKRQLGSTGVLTAKLTKPYELFAAARQHTCGRPAGSNQVECWGSNEHGQLDGTAEPGVATEVPRTTTPFPAGQGGLIVQPDFIATGPTFTCAASNAKVRCWGTMPWPAGEVDGLGEGQITALDVGTDHACVVKGGQAVCWGGNASGQAAPAEGAAVVAPTRVLPAIAVTRIVTGRAHTCAITTAGAVQCWGDGSLGQLGAAGGSPGPTPVIADPAAVGPITAGADVTCALHADDRVRCWGAALELDGTRYDDFDVCHQRAP